MPMVHLTRKRLCLETSGFLHWLARKKLLSLWDQFLSFETIGAREQGQISKKWFRQRGQHGNGRPNVSKNIIFKFFTKKLNTNLLSVLLLAHSVYLSARRQAAGGFRVEAKFPARAGRPRLRAGIYFSARKQAAGVFSSTPSSSGKQAGRGFEPENIFPRESRQPFFFVFF